MKHKLRIGILIDDYLIPAWASKMIKIIKASEHSEIVLIVKKKPTIKEKKSIFYRIWKMRKVIFFILFQKLDSKIFKNSNDAFELKDIRKIIECHEIEVHPKETKFSDIIYSDDIKKMEQHSVDVFIRLGFRILRGEILNSSKYGIWSLHHGDNTVNRGGPAGVWEVLENWDETGVILQILSEDLDGGFILDKSTSSTDKVSFCRNRNNYYWKALSMIPRKLNELYRLGEKDFFDRINKDKAPYFYHNRLFTNPTNIIVLKAFFRIYIHKLYSKLIRLFFFEQWVLLFKLDKLNKISTCFFRFKKILPPKDRFWADPFVIEKNEKYYIFIEELIYKENKGKICVIEMDQNGNYSSPQVVLERNYHLSYPFLFEENETLYMIPETAKNRTIELYKCIEFPTKWEFYLNIMENINAVDSTIVKKDNKYWLFCNIKENQGASICDELFLFYSDSLFNQNWTAHPNNPIVSDVKKSRPAGNIFALNNKLYRPSQNCAKRYGYGITINEITELNEKSYQENTVQSIYPNWEKDIRATHSLSNAGKLTVIDAIYRRRK
ncbi:MAG: hypothetical protein VW080_02640 [Flavobacteriaceae bacterium]